MPKLGYGIVNIEETLDSDNNDGIHKYTYANIPPQTQGGLIEAILSLETRSRKRPGGKFFVKMPAV
jgi:hypothetical protein